MRKIFKYIIAVVLIGGVYTSCETTDLDLKVSPNDLSLTQSDANLMLNSIQLAYVSNMNRFNDLGAGMTRIQYATAGGQDYFTTYPGTTMNAIWSRTYSSDFNDPGNDDVDVGIWTNLDAIRAIDKNDEDNDYSLHIAIAETLLAHNLMLIVDYMGDAVFTQAGNPTEFPAPQMDGGQAVYNSALALLDNAQSLFAKETTLLGGKDFFYGGDHDKWIKLINTIRLRAYVTTGRTADFNAIISGGNYITSTADDFQWDYSDQVQNPDGRHPSYASDYTPSGANIYQPNWTMEYMLDSNDPRLRYYFYRQNSTTPGAGTTEPDEETLACSLVIPPPHYDGFTYCSVENGYWGRSHGNNEGAPPDNFLRTASGVYPAGGMFDDNSYANVGLGKGGAGKGIEPIILASYVDFWQAQNKMAENAAMSEVSTLLRAGMEKSIAKVTSFGDLDTGADKSFEPSAADITTFVNGIIANFDGATGDAQKNIFAEQYWIAMYGGGAEAFNFYRKTGFPTTLPPHWEPNPGSFPRTMLYPSDETTTNPNLTQRTDLSTQVFWDTNLPGPSFPPAN